MESAADYLYAAATAALDASQSVPLGSPVRSTISDSTNRVTVRAPTAHAANLSMISVNLEEYPRFSNGDVLIIVPNGTAWKFHSFHLSNGSSVLRDVLQSITPIHLTKKEKREENKTVRWVLKMELDPSDERFVTFKPTKQQPAKAAAAAFLSNHGHQPRYLNIYDNFFKCIYNIDPTFGNSDISELVYRTFSLLQAAEALNAEPCVRRPIESHLLRANQLLWKQVRDKPEGWADIAIRLQSPVIFREAMIHLTGRWNLPDMIDMQHLRKTDHGAKIKSIVMDKIRKINLTKFSIENSLLTFIPAVMHHPAGKDGNANRSAYTNDIYLWQALSLVRQYIMSGISTNMHHMAPDGGAFFYRQIGEGNAAYLNRDVLEDFHEQFSMSLKGKECLSVAVHYVKEQMRPLVAELLVNRLQILSGPEKFKYLTYFDFSDKDMPWYKTTGADSLQGIDESDSWDSWEDDDLNMEEADSQLSAEDLDEAEGAAVAAIQDVMAQSAEEME